MAISASCVPSTIFKMAEHNFRVWSSLESAEVQKAKTRMSRVDKKPNIPKVTQSARNYKDRDESEKLEQEIFLNG